MPNVEVPRVGAQIDEVLAQHTIGPDDLVVLWAGLNDVRDVPGGMLTPDQVVENLTEHIMTLQAAGAKNFLVNNLYSAEPFTAVNALWSARADELRRTEPIRLHRLDFGRLWSQIETNPAQFGFTAPDWREPIIYRPVANPEEYAFWDNVHPTTAFHRVIAEAALETLRHVDGDFNDNGLVEQGDLDLVLLNWGERVTGPFLTETGWANDLPTRRQVDQDELDRLLLHWGQAPLVPRAPSVSAAIPEPASLVLLLVALIAASSMRRSKRLYPIVIMRVVLPLAWLASMFSLTADSVQASSPPRSMCHLTPRPGSLGRILSSTC